MKKKKQLLNKKNLAHKSYEYNKNTDISIRATALLRLQLSAIHIFLYANNNINPSEGNLKTNSNSFIVLVFNIILPKKNASLNRTNPLSFFFIAAAIMCVNFPRIWCIAFKGKPGKQKRKTVRQQATSQAHS